MTAAPPDPAAEARRWKGLAIGFGVVALLAVAVALVAALRGRGDADVALSTGAPTTAPAATATATAAPTPTPEPTAVPTRTVTATPAATVTPTATATATATATPAPTVAPTSEPEPTPTASAPAAPEPERLVAITEEGRMVLLDARSGEELRELDALAAPGATPAEDGTPAPNTLTDLALSPDGQVVWYGDCCEPAGGNLYTVPTAGGEQMLLSNGSEPEVSPDGSTLAVRTTIGIGLVDARTGEHLGEIPDEDFQGDTRRPTWSPDGSMVAWERLADGGEQVAVAEATGGAAPRAVPRPDGASWQLPAWRADGLLTVAAQCCGFDVGAIAAAEGAVVDPADGEVVATFPHPAAVADQDYDPSGTWLLVTYADGTLVAIDPEGGTRAIGEGFVAASW